MLERFEHEGEWWFPQRPQEKFHGSLKYTPEDGASLHLLIFRQSLNVLKKDKITLINGSSADGTKITLYKCILKEERQHFSEVGLESETALFKPSYVFLGTHFCTPRKIRFNKVSVRFLHLAEWASVSGFKMKPPHKGIMIKYALPKAIKFYINNALSVSVAFGIQYPTYTKPQTEVFIKQSTWLLINPATTKTLDEFLKMIHILQNFFTLAISEPAYATDIEGEIKSEENVESEAEHWVRIKIIFRQGKYILEPLQTLYPDNMLFTLKEISRKKRILRNWFEKTENLASVCDLYFGTLYQKGMYINNEFLNLTQALESYHRRTMTNHELSSTQHQKRINSILKKTPTRYKAWLEKKLEYANEPSLRKRLKDILENCPQAISAKLGNKTQFINKIVDTRNYWTHFDKRLEAKSTNVTQIYELVLKLRILIQTCLLKELGFDSKDIECLLIKRV